MNALHRRKLPVVIGVVLVAGCRARHDPLVYEAMPVERRDIVVAATASGNVEPIDSFTINTRATGEVVRVAVQPGDPVRKGDLLLELDPRIERNAVAETGAAAQAAQAELETADREMARARELFRTQVISAEEFDSVRVLREDAAAGLVRARAQADSARIEFQDAEIAAPANGVVLSVGVNDGYVVSSATRSAADTVALLKIGDIDTVDVVALVDERDIAGVAVGMDALVTVDAFPQQTFVGRVDRIEPQALVQNQATLYRVHLDLPNPGQLLRPGMNAEMSIRIGDHENVLAVPYAALRTRDDVASAAEVLGMSDAAVRQDLKSPPIPGGDPDHYNYLVFVRHNGRLRIAPVETGATDFAWSEVEQGLDAGDTVLVMPSASLVRDQAQMRQRMGRATGLPGVSQGSRLPNRG